MMIADYNRSMVQTPAEKIAILYDVLGWLEANPDKAITGTLAIDDNKGSKTSKQPSSATPPF